MLNYRQFEVGPDPFGRVWKAYFKWLQTAISIRQSDTVDVKFVIATEDERMEKTIAIPHTQLLALREQTGHEMTDAWAARLAAAHLEHVIETAEDIEKEIVTVSMEDLERWAAAVEREEREEIDRRKAAG